MALDSVTVKITGVDELKKKLNGLSVMTRGKAGRTALRKAAQLVQRSAANSAQQLDDPETRESIARNIIVQWAGRTARRTGNPMFRVGVMGGALSKAQNEQNPGGDTWYWRLLHYGFRTRSGGFVDGDPFLEDSLRNNVNPAINEFFKEYEKAIDRFIKRGIT